MPDLAISAMRFLRAGFFCCEKNNQELRNQKKKFLFSYSLNLTFS